MANLNIATPSIGVNRRVPRESVDFWQGNRASEATLQPSSSSNKTTSITTSTTTFKQMASPEVQPRAQVEELGRQANLSSLSSVSNSTIDTNSHQQDNSIRTTVSVENGDHLNGSLEGNKLITSISTIAVQSGGSRIVIALLKDGTELQLRVQEMRGAIFEVGANYKQCVRYFEEHQRLVKSLRKLRKTPVEEWLSKYNLIKSYKEPKMSRERKLVYMCMLENLQACWKSLLSQLERRTNVLGESSKFYELSEQFLRTLDRADNHLQLFRNLFLYGPNASNHDQFKQAFEELETLNRSASEQYALAKAQQRRLVQLIQLISMENLGDSRPGQLQEQARQLTSYIQSYLEPLERRKIQLESVITTTTKTTTTTTKTTNTTNGSSNVSGGPNEAVAGNQHQLSATPDSASVKRSKQIREINSFGDLDLVDGWLGLKIEQLNSSLLSSLGVSVVDSRSLLTKHEQIALECGAIEEATLNYNAKNIHAIKQLDSKDDKFQGEKSLFEQQKLLAERVRDVISILDVRLILLRRTIDFYLRSQQASVDIAKLLRRLQVDNSLQSIEFVANELEAKDVSSVVASGATILSELQQLQLAQQHGHRSSLINLSLVTLGIRSVIDQLNRDLAHLKTVSSQRKLVLLNEDANKMVTTFTGKCHQLHLWLNNQAKVFLLNNNRLVLIESLPYTIQQLRGFCENHQQLRLKLQNKTLEVEALLRSLPTLSENFEAKSETGRELEDLSDQLRRDWISVTNCFDKRLELAKKYLAILEMYKTLERELYALEQFYSGRAVTPDERTDEEIRASIEQIFSQVSHQVKNFNQDAQKNNTELVYFEEGLKSDAGKRRPQVNEINKKEVVDYVNNLLISFEQKYKRTLRPFERASSFLQETEARSSPAGGSLERNRQVRSLSGANSSAGGRADLAASGAAKPEKPPAHQRPQQVDPPRFTRILQDKTAEPFSQVELECETDPNSKNFQIEWFMNNFKRIPPSIKHSVMSESNQHKLIIYNFGPICCGTYQVRASNQAGQVVSQCRLRMSGIQEVVGGSEESLPEQRQQPQPRQQVWSEAGQSTSGANSNQMARIIQGVESPVSNQSGGSGVRSWRNESTVKITQVSSSCDSNHEFPVAQAHHAGGQPRHQRNADPNHLQVTYIDSPVSSTSLDSRSISRSPFEGTPQPPVFTQQLAETTADGQAGLVCLVIGNPPPKIEWLHNDKTVATTRLPKGEQGKPSSKQGSVCKLVIETLNSGAQGNYVCRASNRIGQSSTAITLTR